MITLQRSRREMEPDQPTRPSPTFAAERIELGRRVCEALETENLAMRADQDSRLSATLAAYATICRRADYAHRRAAVAHFARQLRQG
jgi:hypothetical protein